jgi:dolichyl-phosphate beta-glucosyltransferase
MHIPISEVPVHWTEIPGSKFNVLKDLITMARDVSLVRILYMLTVWKLTDTMM